jgi:hypothetical protein
MPEPTITLSTTKFKDILLHSWNLLPAEKQQELIRLGIQPKSTTSL